MFRPNADTQALARGSAGILADLLDRLKEDPAEAPYLCQTAWDTLLYEIREINVDASDDDVRKTVAIIVELGVVFLSQTDLATHRTCSMELLCTLGEHEATGWEDLIYPLGMAYRRKPPEGTDAGLLQEDTFLSDEIYDALHAEEGNMHVQGGQKGTFRIAKGHKTNFAKIVSAMFDLRMFEDDKGQIASNKQKLMDELGALFGTEFKNLRNCSMPANRGPTTRRCSTV